MELPKAQGISIFVRILIVFLCVNIGTSGILIITAFVYNRTTIEKRTKENITQQIQTIRVNFENEYRVNLKRSLETLASDGTLNEYIGASDVEKMVIGKKVELSFLQHIKAYKTYLSMSFVDSFGHINISVAGKLRRKEAFNLKEINPDLEKGMKPSLKARARLFRTLESIPLLLSSGYMEWFMPPREIQLEGPFLEENGSYALLAGISKLDLDIGDFGGVIMIRQNLDHFLSGLRDVQFFDENPIWVFDAKGSVLQHPENKKISFDPGNYLPKTFQGALRLVNVDEGIVAYQDFSILPGKPFIRFVIAIPTSVLFKDFAGAIRFFSIVLVVSILLVLLLTFYMSRYLSRPIIELSAAVSRLAHGDLSSKVMIETTGEVQILVNSFNQMTDNLRETIKSRDASVESMEKEVAERKQMEEQLLQSQKMESLGTFAGGIAHDFNTLIGTIIGYTDIIFNELEDDSPLREYINSVANVANRAKTLVKQIGDFSRPKTTGKTPIDMILSVRSSMNLMRIILPATIQIKETYSPDKLFINANINQINQLVVNLCSNAGDFMSGSLGDLMVGIDRVSRQVNPNKYPGLKPGDHLKLSISDTGVGIDSDKIDRIFDPFYTTKEIGKGSGLGLAIVHSIVQNHSGQIFVESINGEGTTFTIFFPLLDQGVVQASRTKGE